MEEKERYELIGYCSYRDTETGVIGDNFVDILNKQDQQIKSTKTQNERVKEKLGTITNYNQDLEKENQQLKQQNKKLNLEAQKYYEDAYCNNYQNQKAIEELEKVKESAYQSATDISCLLDYTELVRIIDNQIKQLGGGENE